MQRLQAVRKQQSPVSRAQKPVSTKVLNFPSPRLEDLPFLVVTLPEHHEQITQHYHVVTPGFRESAVNTSMGLARQQGSASVLKYMWKTQDDGRHTEYL